MKKKILCQPYKDKSPVRIHKEWKGFDLVELLLLGRWEICGYENKVSANRRIIAALYQTVMACVLLFFIHYLFDFWACFEEGPLGDEAQIALLFLISGIFAGTYINERSNIHSKWTYLANLYNLAISQPDPKMSNKVLSSLAHDILIMDMWAHRSFDDVFHETLFDAVVFAHSDPEECEKELLTIASDGIDYKRAEKLIHDLTVFHEDEYERTFKSTP